MQRLARIILITLMIVVFAQAVHQNGGVQQTIVKIATALASANTGTGE